MIEAAAQVSSQSWQDAKTIKVLSLLHMCTPVLVLYIYNHKVEAVLILC